MNADNSRSKPLIHLHDYQPPAWTVDAIELVFDLDPLCTEVSARLELRQLDSQTDERLHLDGESLELLEIRVNGSILDSDAYVLDERGLTLSGLRGHAVVETRSRIHPSTNKSLQGLYLSGSLERGFLLTQCEAEGFRNITWCLDRPDVLARHDVTLRADRERFPVLLAGGNAQGSGVLADGRHWARFVDAQPRPSYLFALVAGQLESIEDRFTTVQGRHVRLVIWAETDAIGRCQHAMHCLKAAFAWDEQRFARSYQLNAFHIVVTHDFAMGAMENTGLNIFNSKYVLADLEHATDDDFRHVLAVIGHEYFHNWTGNRVTCRDWFQLCLKEGLTVYREQEFESEIASRTLRRIEDVRTLWRAQFAEDAGPLAHPVRPDQYSEINNFYTATIYEKGAEIVRMLSTLLGRAGFRAGMDLYFERHDGQAVTVEDFLSALGDANDRDLRPWLIWYRQAGTPALEASGRFDAAARCYELHLRQYTPPTPGEADKSPLPIPLSFALFDTAGAPLPIRFDAEDDRKSEAGFVLFDVEEKTLRFLGIEAPPVVSLLRGYSAPVRLVSDQTAMELAVLAAHERDGFNRWLASDTLARQAFDVVLDSGAADHEIVRIWSGCLLGCLRDEHLDPATLAEMLTLPDEATLVERRVGIDPCTMHYALRTLELSLARQLGEELEIRYRALSPASAAGSEPAAQAQRRLRNRCLALLGRLGNSRRALAHYSAASTLSDRLAALTSLVHENAIEAPEALVDFESRYRADALVMDKWFSVQASKPHADALEDICALTEHPAFRWDNPNKVYAVMMSVAQRNTPVFHRLDGAGYQWVADAILRVDAITPQISARLATVFGTWRRHDAQRSALMHHALRRMLAANALSPDLADILERSVAES